MSKLRSKRKNHSQKPAVKKSVPVKTAAPQSNVEALLLTTEDVAALLNVSSQTVYRMARQGTLPGRVKIGATVRYHKPTLEKWLAEMVQS